MSKYFRDSQRGLNKKTQIKVSKPGVQRRQGQNGGQVANAHAPHPSVDVQRFADNAYPITPAQVLALQRRAGNRAVANLIQQSRAQQSPKSERLIVARAQKGNKDAVTPTRVDRQVIQRGWFGKKKDKAEEDVGIGGGNVTGTISNNPLSGQSQVTEMHNDLNEDAELFSDVSMNENYGQDKNIEEVNRSAKREKMGLLGYYGTSAVSSGGGYAATQAAPGVFKVGSAAMSGLSAITGAVSSVLGSLWVHAVTKRANRAKERRDLSYEYHKAVKNGENPSRFRVKRHELDKEDGEKLAQTSSEAQQFAKDHFEDNHELQIANAGLNGTPDEQFIHVMEYFATKNEKKRWRARLEGTAYAVGVAGGLATTAGMIALGVGLAALLASNPIGWGIAIGLSFAGVAYTLGQYIHKAIRKGKRWQKGHGGERLQAATVLYQLAKDGHPYAQMFLEELGVLKPDVHGDDIGRTGKSKWYNPFSWGKSKQRKGFFHYKELESNTAEHYYGQDQHEFDVKAKVIEYLMSKARSY